MDFKNFSVYWDTELLGSVDGAGLVVGNTFCPAGEGKLKLKEECGLMCGIAPPSKPNIL